MTVARTSLTLVGDDGQVISYAIWRRHIRFVLSYVRHHNAARAARAAGYVPADAAKTGWELLRRPEIQALIVERERRIALRADITEDYLATELKQNLFRAVDKGDCASVNKAVELLGKLGGFFVDRPAVRVGIYPPGFETIERIERRIIDPGEQQEQDRLEAERWSPHALPDAPIKVLRRIVDPDPDPDPEADGRGDARLDKPYRR